MLPVHRVREDGQVSGDERASAGKMALNTSNARLYTECTKEIRKSVLFALMEKTDLNTMGRLFFPT